MTNIEGMQNDGKYGHYFIPIRGIDDSKNQEGNGIGADEIVNELNTNSVNDNPWNINTCKYKNHCCPTTFQNSSSC